MKQISSPLVSKHRKQNDYNILTSGPNLVEFNTVRGAKTENMKFLFNVNY